MKDIKKLFQQLCHCDKNGACKYWKVEEFGYKKNDQDAVNDKFFPQEVLNKILKTIK